MDILEAKAALDKIIKKSRVHFYKPIQIAEILHIDRTTNSINLEDLSTYKNPSLKWRDQVTNLLVGRSSSSSAQFQHNLFSDNAVPPSALIALGEENRKKNGIVEAYVYNKFKLRFSQLSNAIAYCDTHDKTNFEIEEFIDLFWKEAGLKRSIDKIYEIIVFSLFSSLVDLLEITVTIKSEVSDKNVLKEFSEFVRLVIGINPDNPFETLPAKIFRVGVTNAADRGLDMYSNFGYAIQIKHLSLTEELAGNIVSSVSADRIIIVCKESEKSIILSLLNQIGWKSRIQSIVTENDLKSWYDKALRGKYKEAIGEKVLKEIKNQILIEFPSTEPLPFSKFMNERGYNAMMDEYWN